MLRGVTIVKLAVLALVVLVVNAAFLAAIVSNPKLKDQVPWLILAIAAVTAVGVVAFIIGRTVDEEEAATAGAGLFGLTCFQAALIGGIYYWQSSATTTPIKIPDSRFKLADNSKVGAVIGKIAVEGGNPGAKHFEIVRMDAADGSQNFKLNPSTGELTLARTDMLDARQWPSFTLDIKVTDDFGAEGKGLALVEITDVNQPPVMRDNVMEFNSDTREDMDIGAVTAIDPDNGVLDYRIAEGNDTGLFEIERGFLKITDQKKLPRTSGTFHLVIEASDRIAPPVRAKLTLKYTYSERKPIEQPSFGRNR